MPGATAYYSLNKLGIEPKKGETIFVSAGAGAVGSYVSSSNLLAILHLTNVNFCS